MDASFIIETLGLKPLPGEGGFYRETYRSAEVIPAPALPERYEQDKHFGTAIYYLLTQETFSAIHRLPTDEIFHFYLGDSVTLYLFRQDGTVDQFQLGQNLENGHHLQCIVPKGVWQGMHLNPGGNFALMGTTVSPGFDFEDLDLANRQDLLTLYPNHSHIITRLTQK